MLKYVIKDSSIRGFSFRKKDWCPKKGQILDCELSQTGSVEVVNGKTVNGPVPTELQDVSRKFLKAGGKIQAKVKDDVPVNGTKGEEILCQYIWTGAETPLIENAIKAARREVDRLKKEKQNEKESFKLVPEKRVKTSNKPQLADVAGGSGDSVSSTKARDQVEKRHKIKRRSDEKPEGSEEKLKKKEIANEKDNVSKNFSRLPETKVATSGKKVRNLKYIQSDDMKDGSNLSKKSQSEIMLDGASKATAVKKISNKQVEKPSERRSDVRAEGSEEKLQKKEIAKEKDNVSKNSSRLPETKNPLQEANSGKKKNGRKENKLKVQKECTPAKACALPAKSPRSTPSPFTNSTNKITQYFSPKATSAAVDGNGESLNTAKKQLMQEDKLECDIADEEGHSTTSTPSTEKIPLTQKHLSNFAKHIYGSWESLGIHLGLTKAQIDHIIEDNPRKTEYQIFNMLRQWSQAKPDVCLHDFELIMANCSKDIFQQPELDDYIQWIKDDYRKKK